MALTGPRDRVATLIAYVLLVALLAGLAHSYAPIVVAGGSMRPALTPGDVVVVARRARPAHGDIALLRSGGGLVLHRVTRVYANGSISTRGDANPISDFAPARRSQVRGRVVAVARLGALVERWRGVVACGTLPAQTHSAKR